jgi:cell division protein FtsL
MMKLLRLLQLIMIAALVLAAADVYKIKFESTRQAERVAKLRGEIRRERDTIGALRAEWAELDTPRRIQALAQRHLGLKPIEIGQYDKLDRLPEKPIDIVPPGTADPIGVIIETQADTGTLTGSIGSHPPLPGRPELAIPARPSIPPQQR